MRPETNSNTAAITLVQGAAQRTGTAPLDGRQFQAVWFMLLFFSIVYTLSYTTSSRKPVTGHTCLAHAYVFHDTE